MIQSHENRREAIWSVLPILDLHLDLIARVRSALGGAWESEPSPLDIPPKPKLMTPDMVCDVRCPKCEDTLHCPEEAWVRQALVLRHAYALDAITDSLVRLAHRGNHGRSRAAAVYWSRVEPWENWNPRHRKHWCDQGMDWLADDVRAPLSMYRTGDRDGRLTREEEIVRLREQANLSYHAIAKALSCSKRDVAAALKGKGVRPQRASSARGS